MSGADAENWPRLLDLFDRLVDVEPAQRAQRLDELTADEPELRAHLERLLALDAGADHFVTEAAVARSELLEADAAPPATIGPWRIVHTLGAGGMGRVFLGERADAGFEQRVALKVIRGEFTSDAAIARFLAERRILSRLEHPGIASLIDGGVDARGRPWFAMQYVDGLPLPTYCAEHGLARDARLRLFIAVCEAVAYAHRQLVVHCDLKPSNVMVDAAGQPRLLDFGIAHLLAGDGSGAATATVQHGLTPEYAAPEQLAAGPVGVATDVYALGVMLHELLVGARPAFTDTGGAATPAARPASRTAAAGSPVPARQLRGDLDLVIATALQRDPAQRYPGADAFADDLRHVLEGSPLRAQRDRAPVRLRKFLRRHLVATGLAAIAVLALLAVTTLALVEAHVARGQAARAEAVRSFLIDLFQQNDPDRAAGKTLTATDLVDLGAQRADEGLVGDPDTRIELLGTVGNLYKSLGELPKAEKALQKRLDFASGRYPDGDPRLATARLDLAYVESSMDHIDRARQLAQSALASLLPGKSGNGETRAAALDSLASIERRAGNYTVAARLQRERLALLRTMPSTPPRDIASARGDLADDENLIGQYADAEANGRLAIRILQADPASPPSALIVTRGTLAETMSQTGRLAKAETLYRQNLDLDKRIYGSQSIRVAEALFPLADVIRMQGRFAESIPLFKQALALYENAVGPDHSYVATALTGLAQAQTAVGDAGSATTNLQRAYAIYAAKLGPNHLYALVAEMALAHARLVAGDAAGAVHDYRDALSRFSGPLEHHIYAESARQGLGEALAAEHRFADAEPLLTQAHATLDHAFGAADFRTMKATIALANLLSDEGRATDARKLIEDSRKAVEAAPRNPSTAHQLDQLTAAADHLAAPTPVAR